MKKSTLFVCSTILSLGLAYAPTAHSVGFHTIYSPKVPLHVACWDIGCLAPIPNACTAVCATDLDLPWALTTWIDPFMAAATALDALATGEEQDKTIDAKEALEELEESLKSSESSSSGCDSSETGTTTVEDVQVLAPEIVVKAVESADQFEDVREAVEDYVFTNHAANGSCDIGDNECAKLRQETWTVASVGLAEATMDKIIKKTESTNFSDLAGQFNGKTSPTDMWGGMSAMTLDSLNQANDLNLIYARDLEMNALVGISESGVKEIKRSSNNSGNEE